MKRSGATALLMAGVLAAGLAACGDERDEASNTTTEAQAQPAPVGSPVASIDMLENSFAVSGPLVAGGTLKLSNKGTELHMAVVNRFKVGKTMTDLQRVLTQLASESAGPITTTTVRGSTTTISTTVRGATTTTVAGGRGQNPFADVLEDESGIPGGVLSPGETAEVTVPTLQAGTYALICFLAGEGDGVRHFEKGMVGQLEVVAGAGPTVPTADATYKVAKGRAVEGPTTLTAGRHTIKFEAAAGSAPLEPSLIRLNPGATFAALDAAITKVFEGDTPPAKGAAAKLPGQVVYGGLDFGNVTTLYLTVELKAGTYVINAEDTDVDPKPPAKELITIKVA